MRHRPSTQLVVIGVLAGLLVLLGTLQWRWLGRISADERERMTASLGLKVRELTQEFDRELTRAYFWLQMDRSGPFGVTPVKSTAHFDRWFSSAPDARIVSEIFTVTVTPGGPDAEARLALSRYDRDAETLVPVEDVPGALQPLAARLTQLPPPELPSQRQRRGFAGVPPLQPDVPALLIPRPPVPINVSAEGTIVFSQLDRPWDFTIAVLDTDYIRETYLPSLVEREFGPLAEMPYRVAVVDLASGAPIYCAAAPDVAPPDDCAITEPDVSREFFELRMREFSRFIVSDDRRDPGRDSAAQGPGDPGPRPGRTLHVTTTTTTEPPDGDAEEARRAEGRGPLWRVDVKHRAGSLEAVVASARRRNLFISSSVLLLLGASMALIVMSSGRARRLAAQQMEFVAGVSHELRTPLAVIRSAAENLADGVVADPSQVRQYGTLIAAEGRRLTEMVEQVMEFAGFDAGRALDVRSVSARDVVDAAIQASQPLLAEHQVTIEVTMPEEPPYVLGNQAALSRMLVNLLSNAVKYGGADRWVGVSVGLSGRDHVVFRVSDHGAGIADQDLPHIFEPFFRGRPWTDGHVHGSGLGLSLVSRIVAQHRGKVHVDTQPDRGTTFSVTVPVARDVPATATEPAPVLPSLEAPAWKRGATS